MQKNKNKKKQQKKQRNIVELFYNLCENITKYPANTSFMLSIISNQ